MSDSGNGKKKVSDSRAFRRFSRVTHKKKKNESRHTVTLDSILVEM